MLGGGDVNPPVEDDVQTAYIFSVSGFSMFFRLAFKGGGFNFSQRSQYMKDPAHLKLCLDFCKL